MSNLAKRLNNITSSPLIRVMDLLTQSKKMKNIISFGGGAPSLPPPKEVAEHMIHMLRTNPFAASSYINTEGIAELRNLISKDLKKYSGINLNAEKEIMITSGATEGIFVSLMSITDPGDEVIIFDPTYFGYYEAIKMLDVKPIEIPIKVEDEFQPNLELLHAHITDKTKAIILLSPDNPTGRVIEKGIAKAILELAQDHNFFVLSDEIYKHLIYEGEHVWLAKMNQANDRVITTCSFSKEAAIPGLRTGYMFGPSMIIEAAKKVKQYVTLGSNTLAQMGLMKFLEGDIKERYLEKTVSIYKSRRNVMNLALREYLPLIKTILPSGGFYFFADFQKYLEPINMSEEKFCEEVLALKSVVMLPGKFFGKNTKGHCRLTFVSESENRIEEGISKVAEFLDEQN
jgi:aspartate aminotransferase